MAEDQPRETSITETITMIFRAMRAILVILNAIVIIVATYFLFSARNFAGDPLRMATWLRVVICLSVIATAKHGIVVGVWWGAKCKLHLKLIAAYLCEIAILAVIAIILAAIYVRRPGTADILFIIFTCFATFLLTMSSIAFGYTLKKTKFMRRMNFFSSG